MGSTHTHRASPATYRTYGCLLLVAVLLATVFVYHGDGLPSVGDVVTNLSHPPSRSLFSTSTDTSSSQLRGSTESQILSSPLSPGLSYCSSNPLLAKLDINQLIQREREHLDWIVNRRLSSIYDWVSTFLDEPVPLDILERRDVPLWARGHREVEMVIDTKAGAFPCPTALQRLGSSGDGGKWLCSLEVMNKPDAPCTVYSLGSNNQFDFEYEVSKATTCDIHTFDCTSSAPVTPIERHEFHHKCIGDFALLSKLGSVGGYYRQSEERANWVRFNDVLQNSHKVDTPIHLLKVDIEGGEYKLLTDLLDGSSTALPFQLAIEIHFVYISAAHALMHSAMYQQLELHGYRMVSYEPNEYSPLSTEFTFMRYFC